MGDGSTGAPAGGEVPGVASGAAVVSRRRVLVWFGAGVVGATGVGLLATRLIRSPQQLLADSAPPGRGVLTAPVEFRVLRDTVVLRGTVGAGSSLEVTPVPSQGRPVVTGVRVATGEEFALGAVLVEVAGRPVLALAGEVPAYRDLRPGMTGRDVMQLQTSLDALGHDPGSSDGVFGAGTKQALRDLYRELGYEVATTGDEAALAGAEQRVTSARRALEQAQQALALLEAAPPPSPGPGEPDLLEQARAQVRFAQEDLDAAVADRTEVVRTSGPMVPLSEYVFLPEFPARVEQSSARVGAEVTPPLLVLSGGALVVRAQLNPGQRDLVAEGMAVQILSELHNISAAGVVAGVGELVQDESGGRSHPMLVTPTQSTLDERLAGADVRLTVEAAATEGEVLVVPLTGVYAGADGATAVLKLLPDGSQQRVVVTAGVSGDGYVAVVPVDGSLTAGDLVVVGAGTSP
jgi:peptidoglycan hydrolase-like protein with peptidoglycan-binding domain